MKRTILLLFIFLFASPGVASDENITSLDQLVNVLDRRNKYRTWKVVNRKNVSLKEGTSATTVIVQQTRWRSLTQRGHSKGSKDWKEYYEKVHSYNQFWVMPKSSVSGAVKKVKDQLKPTDRSHEHHRERMYLGHNNGKAFFGYAPFYVYHIILHKNLLKGGEDPIATAVRVLHYQTSEKTHEGFLEQQGKKAIPYIQRALKQEPERPAAFFSVLLQMKSKRAVEVVIDHLDSSREKLANEARDQLLRYPQMQAKSHYLNWLKNPSDDVGVMDLIDAIQEVNLQKQAVPELKAYLQKPNSLRGYVRAVRLKRKWSGNLLSDELQEAEKNLSDASHVGQNEDVEQERKQFHRGLKNVRSFKDDEALTAIGLSLILNSGFKVKEDWSDEAGLKILQSVPKTKVKTILHGIHARAEGSITGQKCNEIHKKLYNKPIQSTSD
jgi:hypothetical protein